MCLAAPASCNSSLRMITPAQSNIDGLAWTKSTCIYIHVNIQTTSHFISSNSTDSDLYTRSWSISANMLPLSCCILASHLLVPLHLNSRHFPPPMYPPRLALLILRPTNHPLIALLCHPTKCEGLHQSFTRDVVCHHHQHHRGCKPILYLKVRIFDINFSTLIVSSLIVSHLSVQCQTSVCALWHNSLF